MHRCWKAARAIAAVSRGCRRAANRPLRASWSDGSAPTSLVDWGSMANADMAAVFADLRAEAPGQPMTATKAVGVFCEDDEDEVHRSKRPPAIPGFNGTIWHGCCPLRGTAFRANVIQARWVWQNATPIRIFQLLLIFSGTRRKSTKGISPSWHADLRSRIRFRRRHLKYHSKSIRQEWHATCFGSGDECVEQIRPIPSPGDWSCTT